MTQTNSIKIDKTTARHFKAIIKESKQIRNLEGLVDFSFQYIRTSIVRVNVLKELMEKKVINLYTINKNSNTIRIRIDFNKNAWLIEFLGIQLIKEEKKPTVEDLVEQKLGFKPQVNQLKKQSDKAMTKKKELDRSTKLGLVYAILKEFKGHYGSLDILVNMTRIQLGAYLTILKENGYITEIDRKRKVVTFK